MDIELSARSFREVEFREKVRGYNQDDVDQFLEQAATSVEVLHDRLRQTLQAAMQAERRIGNLPDDHDALRRTLALAQRTADMAVKESQQHASEILNSSQTEAQAVLAEAHERVRRTGEEAERYLRASLVRLGNAREELRQDIKVLEGHLESERGRMRAALAETQAWMDENLSGMAPAPALSEVDVPPPPVSTGPAEGGASASASTGPRLSETPTNPVDPPP
jgi:cell division initiation protein